MIRFINLTGQIFIDDPELHFAWFDTIIDQFMRFNCSQEWNTWEEFKGDLLQHCHDHNMSPEVTARCLLRFEKLFQFKNHPTNSSPSSKE